MHVVKVGKCFVIKFGALSHNLLVSVAVVWSLRTATAFSLLLSDFLNHKRLLNLCYLDNHLSRHQTDIYFDQIQIKHITAYSTLIQDSGSISFV